LKKYASNMMNAAKPRKTLVVILTGLSLCLSGTTAHAVQPQSLPPAISQATKVPGCLLKGKRLFGSVYIEKSKYAANFSVYQGSSKYSTDLSVFSTNSKYSATSCGLWYFVNSKYQADFSVYFVNSKYQADFSAYFVNSKYQAGTN